MPSDDEDPTVEGSASSGKLAGKKTELQETATKFLDHDDIKDAPVPQKKAFLRRKGLSEEEIEILFSQNDETESSTKDRSREADSDPQKAPSSGETPPIITYPEFLLHSQRPKPLVTIEGLLTTAYLVCGAAAVTYSASKYLVEPMLESLTSSRHSLHETASTNLQTLNQRLEKVVSKLPERARGHEDEGEGQDAGDVQGEAYFSRTVATQTSPPTSRAQSLASTKTNPAKSTVQSQTTSLCDLKASLQQMNSTENKIDMKPDLDDLQAFIITLPYLRTGPSSHDVSRSGTKKGQPDGIAKMKAEIKAVKGTLLSARTFPTTASR